MKQTLKKMAVLISVALVCAPMGAMAANKLIVKDSQGTVDKMVVTDSGFIGIGTSTPGSAITAIGTNSNSAQFVSYYNALNSLGGGGFVMLHNNGTGVLPKRNDRIGYFYFGTVDVGSLRYGAGLAAYAEGNWVSGAATQPTYLAFNTSHNAIERMRITSAGNVGIGATYPSQKLEVNGGVRLATVTARPWCGAVNRGTIWVTQGAVGVADVIEVCVKQANDSYLWKAL